MWMEDIDYLVENLEKKHKNLYHTISREDFTHEVNLFKENLINLSDIGKYIEIKSIVAKIGDGHTSVFSNIPLNWFPINFQKFDDGVYVISCSAEYEEILGTRIVGINDINFDKVLLDLSELNSYDNEISLNRGALLSARCANFLKYYNIIDDIESTTFEFELSSGEFININIDSFYHNESSTDWVSIEDKYKSIGTILYKKNMNDFYWYEYFSEDNLVYFQYNSCNEDEHKPIKEYISELLSFCDKNLVDKFVFDIRNNGGGNSSIIEPLINELASNEKINQFGNLYVVIGENTFSSAILNAIKLRQETNAILIGKPTGGKPNHYGEVRTFTLPNSGIMVSYSTKYFQLSDVEEDSIYPDIEIKYMFDDFVSGIDPVMREIFK